MSTWTRATNSAWRSTYCAATPARTATRDSAAWTTLRTVTTAMAATAMTAAMMAKATFCSAISGVLSLLPLDLGADFERFRRRDRLHPFAELVLVVQEVADVRLGVLVLRAPEEGVEG